MGIMNKKAQGDLHGHYHGNIPIFIWILIVAIGCILLGSIMPGLSVLLTLGIVLFIIWIGILIIYVISELQ